MKLLSGDLSGAKSLATHIVMMFSAMLSLLSVTSSRIMAQDRFDLLQWAPQDLHGAIWTDDLSVTATPLATSIAEAA
jgi:hypothetical protein